jgi:hypothetical protein
MGFQICTFYIKNKLKIWTVWTIHSSISRRLGSKQPADWEGAGAAQGQDEPGRWHTLILTTVL